MRNALLQSLYVTIVEASSFQEINRSEEFHISHSRHRSRRRYECNAPFSHKCLQQGFFSTTLGEVGQGRSFFEEIYVHVRGPLGPHHEYLLMKIHE